MAVESKVHLTTAVRAAGVAIPEPDLDVHNSVTVTLGMTYPEEATMDEIRVALGDAYNKAIHRARLEKGMI